MEVRIGFHHGNDLGSQPNMEAELGSSREAKKAQVGSRNWIPPENGLREMLHNVIKEYQADLRQIMRESKLGRSLLNAEKNGGSARLG